MELGGIVGSMYVGKINYCSNFGEISSLAKEYGGNQYAGRSGGIIGTCSKSDVEIDRVCNFGKVICINNPYNTNGNNGGIVGLISDGKKNMVTNSYNKGVIDGGDYKGEIIGYNKISEAISNSFYYKRDGSSLLGIGGSNETDDAYFSGTSGDIEFDYESLEEFLSKKVSN